jgi:hypothetical protein
MSDPVRTAVLIGCVQWFPNVRDSVFFCLLAGAFLYLRRTSRLYPFQPQITTTDEEISISVLSPFFYKSFFSFPFSSNFSSFPSFHFPLSHLLFPLNLLLSPILFLTFPSFLLLHILAFILLSVFTLTIVNI